MDKQQILTAVFLVPVIAIALYRLLWVGSAAAAGAGLRRFPKTSGKLLKWLFSGREEGKNANSKE